MDGLGYTGATVEYEFFSVYSSLVFIDQCFCLFQPIKAIAGIGTIESGNLLKSLVDMGALLIFSFLQSLSFFFLLFPFFFHSFPFFLLFFHVKMFFVYSFLLFPLSY